MRLLVGDHLQAVLDHTQIDIGLGEILERVGADPVVGMQLAQHFQRARSPHLRPAAAEDELLGLDEELDFADAAAPELDVVAGHRDALVTLDGVDLALHRVDVGDRRVVEILAPDEGREIGEKTLPEREIAGDRARLDHRRALPILAERLVIGVGAGGRHGDRGRGGIGAQPQIDAQDIALAGALLQNARERLGDAHEQRRRLDADRKRARWRGRRG